MPAVKAAAALGRPVAADVVGGSFICRPPSEDDRIRGDAGTTGLVDQLHHYEARAGGYTRQDADEPAVGRFVFSYARPWQAREDLAGRSELVEAGQILERPAPAGVDPTARLIDARVDGSALALDIEPANGNPGSLLVDWRVSFAPFAMCRPSTQYALQFGQST